MSDAVFRHSLRRTKGMPDGEWVCIHCSQRGTIKDHHANPCPNPGDQDQDVLDAIAEGFDE